MVCLRHICGNCRWCRILQHVSLLGQVTISHNKCSVPSTLAVHQRIVFKLLLFVYRAVHHLGPTYLSSLVTPYTQTKSLRSAEQSLLTVPRYHLERYGRRSFSVAVSILWNALPHAIRNADSVATFKEILNAYLFRQAFVQLGTLQQ